MKHNWTYKKLGEVATYINGFAFKPSDWKLQGLPIIRIQNLNDPSAEYNFYDKEIAPKYIVNDGDILISWSASLGVYEWQRGKAVLNQHIFKVVFDKSDIDKHYLKYCVEAKLTDMSRLAHGATMRHIVKGDFDNTRIPIPSLDEQQTIVRELDAINRLIDLQEEQLREYDRLAQSLFYTTFGDPISNPKGWEVKKLGDIADTYRGLTYSKKDEADISSKKVLRSNNIDLLTHSLDLEDVKCLREDFSIPDDKKLKKDSIFICMSNGSLQHLGKVAYIDRDYDYAFGGFMGLIIPSKSVSARFVFHTLLSPAFLHTILKEGRGANINNLKFSDIEKFPVPLPPLALQQTFAAQIEAIEQQKALIRKSLEDTCTLLAARMQYYFE